MPFCSIAHDSIFSVLAANAILQTLRPYAHSNPGSWVGPLDLPGHRILQVTRVGPQYRWAKLWLTGKPQEELQPLQFWQQVQKYYAKIFFCLNCNICIYDVFQFSFKTNFHVKALKDFLFVSSDSNIFLRSPN